MAGLTARSGTQGAEAFGAVVWEGLPQAHGPNSPAGSRLLVLTRMQIKLARTQAATRLPTDD